MSWSPQPFQQIIIQGGIKTWLLFTEVTLYSCRQLCQILIDFQNWSNVSASSKFVVLTIKDMSHLKCVATLPCEIPDTFLTRQTACFCATLYVTVA